MLWDRDKTDGCVLNKINPQVFPADFCVLIFDFLTESI